MNALDVKRDGENQDPALLSHHVLHHLRHQHHPLHIMLACLSTVSISIRLYCLYAKL